MTDMTSNPWLVRELLICQKKAEKLGLKIGTTLMGAKLDKCFIKIDLGGNHKPIYLENIDALSGFLSGYENSARKHEIPLNKKSTENKSSENSVFVCKDLNQFSDIHCYYIDTVYQSKGTLIFFNKDGYFFTAQNLGNNILPIKDGYFFTAQNLGNNILPISALQNMNVDFDWAEIHMYESFVEIETKNTMKKYQFMHYIHVGTKCFDYGWMPDIIKQYFEN